MAQETSVWRRFANSPFATAAAFSAVILGCAWTMYRDVGDSIDATRLEIKQDLKDQRAESMRASERSEDKAEARLSKVDRDFDRLEARMNNLDAKLDRVLDAIKAR